MLVKHPKGITETEITEMAKDARGQVNRIYLHWTAGYYGQAYNDYHFCVDREGQVYRHCRELTERKEHTWLRNSGAVCGAGLREDLPGRRAANRSADRGNGEAGGAAL